MRGSDPAAVEKLRDKAGGKSLRTSRKAGGKKSSCVNARHSLLLQVFTTLKIQQSFLNANDA